ncbi:hypothetical protein SAMN04488556_3382 [Halostagnicola kamekurae]|uniref:Uncharacterized protein n=1 Tax=Halostagnicola kamekurae TaxID=619731 RepID=A0A1I6TS43_9EURY|nr:hypothetical protein SAMN04488556_3382 [Halostagnicola kamekurae]
MNLSERQTKLIDTHRAIKTDAFDDGNYTIVDSIEVSVISADSELYKRSRPSASRLSGNP